MRIRVYFVFAVIYMLVSTSCFAYSNDGGRLLPQGYKGFEIWQQDFLRVRFMRSGVHAVNPEDNNNNNCPDFVEDVATQILAAHAVLHGLGGFPHPLESERYYGAKYMDVVIYNKEKLKGYRGICFDEMSTTRDPSMGKAGANEKSFPKVKVLVIYINRDIDPKKNYTPAHEYFHHVQNGTTHFKNRWFYEGMALWSGDVLSTSWVHRDEMTVERARQALHLLENDALFQAEILHSVRSATKKFWEPISQLCPQAHLYIAPDAPVASWRYTDGSLVLKDTIVAGAYIMREALYAMGAIEVQPFTKYHYGTWSEENQRNEHNTPYLIEAIQRGAQTVCP